MGSEVMKVLPALRTDRCTRDEVMAYFQNGWDITEMLFRSLVSDDVFYMAPDSLRQPLIFYYGHVAVFYVNKLIEAKVLGVEDRLNVHFEGLFAIGVDEMSWDSLIPPKDFPALSELRAYRAKVHALVKHHIYSLDLTLPVAWDSAYWALLMGMEHERIHIETSSVLFRQLPLGRSVQPAGWPPLGPHGNVGKPVQNEWVELPSATVQLGKPYDFASYGWDNEYGQRSVTVPPFRAQKYLCTNAQFRGFVRAGGYDDSRFWTEEGWQWKTFRKVTHPLFWVPSGDATDEYKLRTMFEEIDMPWDWPVEVNFHEAKAYCMYHQLTTGESVRLETEAERKVMLGPDYYRPFDEVDKDFVFQSPSAADSPKNPNWALRYGSSTPVTEGPQSVTGLVDVVGNVWRWAEDEADALPGFRVHPYYFDFSAPCFDSRHNMIFGGSWISVGDEASVYARFWFRRHFFQHCGFRLVQPLPADRDLYPISDNPHKLTNNKWHNEANVYEQESTVQEYLVYSYGSAEQVYAQPHSLPLPSLLTECFQKRCADVCLRVLGNRPEARALDLGCGVGRSTFELARGCTDVLGIEYSHYFVYVCEKIAQSGRICARAKVEGDIFVPFDAVVDPAIDRSRVRFAHGDASALPSHLKDYDVVLAANLIDRLSDPAAFVRRLPALVVVGGFLVLTSPYTWGTAYTPHSNFFGGYANQSGPHHTLPELKAALKNSFELVETLELPMLIREHARKYQLCFPQCSVWRRI